MIKWHKVVDIPIKSHTKLYTYPSLEKNTVKTFSQLLKGNVDICVSSDNDLKYPTILMKMHIDTSDHKPIALKPYKRPVVQST